MISLGFCRGKKGVDVLGALTAVFKVDFHCDGCTERIRQCIKGFKGLVAVKVERDSSRLTVVGSMDPQKLLERIQKKTHKNVELIIPKTEKKHQHCCMTEPKKEKQVKSCCETEHKKKTPKEKPVFVFSTVVLKIPFRCDRCTSRIRDTIYKINGVEQVIIDREKSLVTIQGTMKTEGLAELLARKIRRPVELVSQKTSCHDDATCHSDLATYQCMYAACHADVAVRKCCCYTCDADVEVYNADVVMACGPATCHDDVGVHKCCYHTCDADVEVYNADAVIVCGPATCHDDVALLAVDDCGYRYRVDRVYASQIFSDENPNGCSVM